VFAAVGINPIKKPDHHIVTVGIFLSELGRNDGGGELEAIFCGSRAKLC